MRAAIPAPARRASPGLRPPSPSGSLALARPARRADRLARSSRQPEHPLGGDVALDLVRARVDRARQCELVALLPRRIEVEIRTDEVERDLVELDVELAPP